MIRLISPLALLRKRRTCAFHDKPKEAASEFTPVFNELGLTLPAGLTPEPADYARHEEVEDRPDREMPQTMIR